MTNYEQYTYSFLLDRALQRVPNTFDKREGSIIYDALAPACYELAEAYMELKSVFERSFADTATGDDLARRTAELGVVRTAATPATRIGEFDIDVPLGSRFSIENVNYYVSENLYDFKSKLVCEQAGVIGNQYSGTLQPIDYINSLTVATLTEILIPGEDEESDEALRARYFNNLIVAPFGGNQLDYKERTTALAGVGGTKVYPVWNGGGTVKLVIIDGTYGVPSGALVSEVQTIIDPVVNAGLGVGIAPIGHVVTVAGATSLTVNIISTITLSPGYNWNQVSPVIITNLQNYMLQLRKDWDSESQLVVRQSQVESEILAVTGVLDVTNTRLNGTAANIILGANVIPLLGTVTNG